MGFQEETESSLAEATTALNDAQARQEAAATQNAVAQANLQDAFTNLNTSSANLEAAVAEFNFQTERLNNAMAELGKVFRCVLLLTQYRSEHVCAGCGLQIGRPPDHSGLSAS